jgi:hypothetical protein
MNLSLKSGLYLEPTPAGAYFASSSPSDEPARRLLLGVMSEKKLPASDISRLSLWSGQPGNEALELVKRLQELGWLSGSDKSLSVPEGPLEEILPGLLSKVSIIGKALLADDQGFYLSTSGIPHEAAEALSAVSADLSSLYVRHQRLLAKNLGLKEQAWTLADAAGNSQLGFWPLYIGQLRFVLIIQGRPTLNQPAFRDLVWVLSLRYSETFGLRENINNG